MADAPKARIATVKGVWVKPGVSKNHRLYTKAHIAAAVDEAQKHIDAGGSALTVLTHHAAADPYSGDATRTVGRVTKVGVDSTGNGTFEADIADTDAGRAIAALVTPEKPYIGAVSMRAAWKSDPHTVQTAEGPATVADEGFGLRGIDFTTSPGVTGAGLTSAEMAESVRAGLIAESIEEVTFVEDTNAQATEPSQAANTDRSTYADPGYQKDKKKRYPLTSAKRVRAAWSYINQEKNAAKYTTAQLKRVKARITKAAKKFKVDVAAEAEFLTSELTEVLEAYASMSLTNGTGTVRVSAWVNDPEELKAVGKRIALATLAGLDALDPDDDGDVDTTEDDTTEESAPCANCGADVATGSKYCPACGQAVPASESTADSGDTQEGGSQVGTETGTAAAESTPRTFTADQVKEMVIEASKTAVTEALAAAGVKPPEPEAVRTAREAYESALTAAGLSVPAPGAPTTEGTTTETQTESFTADKVKELVAEAAKKGAEEATEAIRGSVVKELRETGIRRRGLIAESESTEDVFGVGDDAVASALKDASTDQLRDYADKAFSPLIAAGR